MTTLLAAEKIEASAIARGRAIKRANAWTAVLCGGLPAGILGVLFPSVPERWLIGFLIGLLWANGFEYAYHRFVLHLRRNFLSRGHMQHHISTGTPVEAEHVNLGGSPLWVALLFVANGVPIIILDSASGLGVAPGMFVAFAVYVVAVEEIHWRFHLGEWLPLGLRTAREHHLAHHDRADTRFNVFLPLFDWLFGTAKT